MTPDTHSLWFFENVDLYEMLCPHKLEDHKDDHKYYHYNKGQFIYFEKEPADQIYMIAKGRVKIGSYSQQGKEITKTILSKGEVFGEMALTGEEYREDFAQAMTEDTTVCPMNIDLMQQLMLNNKSLSLKIFRLIGFRFKKLERRLESLVFKDARTRVIDFIRELAVERGQKVGFETMVKNQLTHQDIANLTGTSRQTVTTILNDLRDQNLINFDRRKILIRDMDKLY
ncbi:MAG: Crp/Fnr family transcriptional regulator [Cyclobacteriaceae bacterium]|nr:Crp/Fnr family transcriptional regulator [Cyclobacteriaceae bacterium]